MRADYEKPSIEFEDYELNTAIAAGCVTIVNIGPADGCSDYAEDIMMAGQEPMENNFYEGSCSCYVSAGEAPVYTS